MVVDSAVVVTEQGKALSGRAASELTATVAPINAVLRPPPLVFRLPGGSDLKLEVGHSARTGPERARALRTPPLSAMPVEYSTPTIEDRAIDVQGQLAERGQHRAPSIPDLLIAATAEISNRIVLHLDNDFELIAELTGQGKRAWLGAVPQAR